MATIFGRIADWIRGKVRTTPVPPQIKPSSLGLEGEVGFAIGLGKDPTDKNRRKMPSKDVEGFIYDGDLIYVNSSNVLAAQYHPEVNKMMVEFHGGKSSGYSAYLYSNVSIDEAISFAQAQSKGAWVWDHLRVRGSRTAHKKPYTKISGPVFKQGNQTMTQSKPSQTAQQETPQQRDLRRQQQQREYRLEEQRRKRERFQGKKA